MFELWIMVDGYGMFLALESNNLTSLKAIEEYQAWSGTVTEIRIKGGKL